MNTATTEFSYGTSDRGASIRIPWAVAKDKKGWLEDRRPNANMDPYVVTRLMINTVCGAAAGMNQRTIRLAARRGRTELACRCTVDIDVQLARRPHSPLLARR